MPIFSTKCLAFHISFPSPEGFHQSVFADTDDVIPFDETSDSFDVGHSRQSSVFHHPVEKFKLKLIQCSLLEKPDSVLCQLIVTCRIFSPMWGSQSQAEISCFAERGVGRSAGK